MTSITNGDIALVLSLVFAASIVPDLTAAGLKRLKVPGDERLVQVLTRTCGCLGLVLALASTAGSLGGAAAIVWIRVSIAMLVGLAIVGAALFISARR